MKRIVFALFFASLLASCKGPQTPATGVVATNAWTAAYAMAAGATDVRVLTPYEMVHPSEYELRPGDITHLNNAQVIIFAGYEVMMEQIRSSLRIDEDRMLQVYTSYDFEEIERSVMLIAEKLGTQHQARENLNEIENSLRNARNAVAESGLNELPAVVHFFQQSLAAELGIHTIALFGPAPPEPRQILELTRTNASMIIDNAHNPSGGALRETLNETHHIVWLNFPGMHGTRTLSDVIDFNAQRLREAGLGD